MLCVLITKQTKTKKGHKKTFGGDGCVYHFDYSDGDMSVFIYPNSPNCVHLLCEVFVYRLYLKKAGKRSAWRFSKTKIS